MAKPQKPTKRKSVTERKFTPQQMIDAIEKSMGSVAVAARALKCKRPTIYNYMRAFPEVQKFLDKVRQSYKETCQEFARDNHLTALMQGDAGATHYELAKMEPKPIGVSIDPTKLPTNELLELQRLLLKAKPDGPDESEI